MDLSRYVKGSIQQMTGYPAPPLEKVAAKLNQNENPFDLPVDIKRELAEKLLNVPWNRYPKAEPSELRHKLSRWIAVPAESILLGNGSNQLYQTLVSTVLRGDDKLVYCPPTFSLYEIFGRIYETKLIPVPLDERFDFPLKDLLETCRREKPALTVLCSPNNPTGSEVELDFVRRLCRESAGLVFWDEAYAEFSRQNALTLLSECENLIISRTFSKACSMAGLRLGYLIGHPQLIAEIRKVNLPFSINSLTETVALALLDHQPWIEQNVRYLVRERDWMYGQLSMIEKIKVYPSQANFFLIHVPDALSVIAHLREQGIAVRNIGGSDLRLHDHFRVSVSLHEENQLFIRALTNWVKK
ncbi:MAG TPA: histidinol-phosphate transaminase [bacterium]|nr:histidinol-phosphate transaminase [bacterium]HNT66120.1 histidinol-phosphate transaminase [bacterium]HOX87048.1 histidinol-phosphate transaminase [bacterium]HPG46379.1 histidinol-phosphate transaminase [bacterium]HPM98707.1 histidinol-phosphate transaminase [bacterium]